MLIFRPKGSPLASRVRSCFASNASRAIPKLAGAIALVSLSAACVTVQQAPAPTPVGEALTNTPNLSPYTRFELYSQSDSAREGQRSMGTLSYRQDGAYFEVRDESGRSIGRLLVQPDACQDDPSPDCRRRFSASGRVQLGDQTLTCVVPIRNDANAGYAAAQALSGICQSQHRRAFTLHLSTR